MKNFAYTGDARSDSPTRTTEYPSAASPLILIVEDHEDTRFLLRYLLEKRGYLVVETEDGEAGVRAAEALSPDLILMDRSLPRIGGISAMRRIRERAELRRVPVIFLSGHAHPADREAAFTAGCDDYLIKPFETEQLYGSLEKHLARHEPQSAREIQSGVYERSAG